MIASGALRDAAIAVGALAISERLRTRHIDTAIKLLDSERFLKLRPTIEVGVRCAR